jgi:two-component system invasion response regulator UvrY
MPAPSTSGSVRVLTADDNARFRATARDLIEATSGFSPIGEADSGERALELAAELGPDLVLMDVHMPGIGGVEAVRRLRRAGATSVLVLVSADGVEDLPSLAWTCGASAILPKERLRPQVLIRLWELLAAQRPERPLTSREL